MGVLNMGSKIFRILLVENDPKLIATLTEILNSRGFEIISVDTGKAAITHAKQQSFDVVLTQLHLEDVSGLDLIRNIKAHSPTTECILIIEQQSRISAIDIVNAGAYSYFLVPLDLDQLVLSIRKAGEKRVTEISVQSIEREIAERKQVEDALRHSEERFRSLYENAIVGMYRTAPNGQILTANPSLMNMLGFESIEILLQQTLTE
jgi:DNA-binding NtrC family response regulator